MKPDEEVRVIVLPREYCYSLTPEGEVALDARAVADEARKLARQRRDAQIDGAPPFLVQG
jgi:hypothetical protein